MDTFWRPWQDNVEDSSQSASSGEDAHHRQSTGVRRYRKVLERNAQQQVIDLHRFFINERRLHPVKNVCEVFNLGRSTVYKILKNGARSPVKTGRRPSKFAKVDSFQQDVVRTIMDQSFAKKEALSLDGILERVKTEIPAFPYERSNLHRLLVNMGFR